MNWDELAQLRGGVDKLPQAPHCDARVLHAPGECEFCDDRPDWQDYRVLAGIAFTGHDPDLDAMQAPCPSVWHRPPETVNRWPGNRPQRKRDAGKGWFG